jgi:hypothetical protein
MAFSSQDSAWEVILSACLANFDIAYEEAMKRRDGSAD